MSDRDLETAVKLITLLVDYGIPAGQALVRSIKAIFGSDLTPEQEAAMISAMENDARIRSILAHADAKGGS